MSDANKALAEVRGWLCDNLGSGDAGKVCGMLSVVSRRINELLDENEKLRELVREIWRSCSTSEDDCARCPHRIEESDEVWCDIPILMGELGVLDE